jgi:hypothetical protein
MFTGLPLVATDVAGAADVLAGSTAIGTMAPGANPDPEATLLPVAGVTAGLVGLADSETLFRGVTRTDA